MATIISSKTSGVGGLTVTGDNSGVLQLASADGTTALTIDASQNVTFAGSVNTPNTFGFKNLLIDAGFIINQRAYVSAATLASGSYGHDRWKAGASGGDYSFTQNASSTAITIASGKSLIQVVEDKNVNGTSFVLSWTGTAQARYAVNSATPAGSYAASPILITGQTQGTTMSVEFNTGTLTTPQLEKGSTATSFDYRAYGTELNLCQRYYQNIGSNFSGATEGTTLYSFQLPFWQTMRVAPTCTARTGFYFNARYSSSDVSILNPTFTPGNTDSNGLWGYVTSSGLTANYPIVGRHQNNTGSVSLDDFIATSAEL